MIWPYYARIWKEESRSRIPALFSRESRNPNFCHCYPKYRFLFQSPIPCPNFGESCFQGAIKSRIPSQHCRNCHTHSEHTAHALLISSIMQWVPIGFFGIRDYFYFKPRIRDFTAKWGRDSGLKAFQGMPEIAIEITGLKNLIGEPLTGAY